MAAGGGPWSSTPEKVKLDKEWKLWVEVSLDSSLHLRLLNGTAEIFDIYNATSSSFLFDIFALASSSGGGGRFMDNEGNQQEPSNQEEIIVVTRSEREKERRKRVKSNFASLQAKLPHLPAKSDQATILEAAERYISSLENQIKELQILNQGKSNAPNTRESTIYHTNNLSIDVSGSDARICLIAAEDLLATVLSVLKNYNIEVKSTQVSGGDSAKNITIHTHEARAGLLLYFPVNVLYTTAAREIQSLINPE